MNDATPWVDPELIAAGKRLQDEGFVVPDRTVASIVDVRAAQDRVGAFLGLDSVPLQHEEDMLLPGPRGDVPCRLYYPEGVDNPACLVYAHGGAFVQGSLGSWDHYLRELVRQAGIAVLSVDYRLAPEHRFPAAFDDMVAVTRLAAGIGADWGIDPRRLAVGGDSAGANLALGTALALRDAGDTTLSFQLLVYGVYLVDCDSPSWQRFGEGVGLTRASMSWAWDTYLQNPALARDWRAAPLLADLKGLPPAHLIVGNLDPLLDDSARLAAKLKEAGVGVDLTIYQGINHGFIRYGRFIGTARTAIAECAAALKKALT